MSGDANLIPTQVDDPRKPHRIRSFGRHARDPVAIQVDGGDFGAADVGQ